MKKLFVLFALSIYCIILSAQKLELTEVDYKLSKEAVKANKSGVFAPAGTYWNEDKSKLYQFYAFTPKKSNTTMMEVVTVEENGKVAATETVPFTDENLSKYNLVEHEAASQDAKKELEGLEVAFIRNPTLAGVPKVIRGTFVDRYQNTDAGSIWVGFKFQKEEEQELNDKFWSYVSFPMGDEVIGKNSHLIAAPSLLGKAVEGFGQREYLNAKGKAYIVGLKATVGTNEFISGILNVADGSWDSQHTIDVGMEGAASIGYYRYENGNVATLIYSRYNRKFKLLYLDAKGALLNLSDLENPYPTQKLGNPPSALLQKVGNQLLAITGTYETMGTKNIGLSVSPLQDGAPLANWTYTTEDLTNKLVLPPKQKVKFEKLNSYKIQTARKLQNGDYLINGYARWDKSNSVDRVFLAIQISSDGDLKATYFLGAIQLGKDQAFAQKHEATHGPIFPTVKETKDGFFWIERAVLKGYEKGVHTSSNDYGSYTRYNAVRVDDTWALGQVVRVNTTNTTISNVVTIEDQILGDRIGDLSKNGNLALFTGSGLVILK